MEICGPRSREFVTYIVVVSYVPPNNLSKERCKHNLVTSGTSGTTKVDRHSGSWVPKLQETPIFRARNNIDYLRFGNIKSNDKSLTLCDQE